MNKNDPTEMTNGTERSTELEIEQRDVEQARLFSRVGAREYVFA